MTALPREPRYVRGALVGFDLFNPLASIIVFQYNPERLTRTLVPSLTGSDAVRRAEPAHFAGAPVETLALDVEIDAADQLESSESIATTMGIHPQLAALEMLLYPKSATVIVNTVALATAGRLEVVGPAAPTTMLVWGAKRAVPVRLTGLQITEDAHDTGLNPLRATVSLALRVLTYDDFRLTHPGYSLFLAHQVAKEVMAEIGSANRIADIALGGPRPL